MGTFAGNHSPHVELYCGISGRGAVRQTINIRLSGPQTEDVISNSAELDTVINLESISTTGESANSTLNPFLSSITNILEPIDFKNQATKK